LIIQRVFCFGPSRTAHSRIPTGEHEGGPPSPLLANVPLDEVGGNLKRRGHSFVRHDTRKVDLRNRPGRAGAGEEKESSRFDVPALLQR
jgi:hypothetical protein